MTGLGIVLTAWHTQDYIEECLDSIAKQTHFRKNGNYEILLGIDSCEETLEKVKSIMWKYKNLKVYMMNENVGTYVCTNTMISKSKYDWILRFDTDDIMLPNMVETIIKHKGDADYVRFIGRNFGKLTNEYIGVGSVCIKKGLIVAINGYKPMRFSADTELYKRIKEYFPPKDIRKVLYKRRIHCESLTQNDETGLHTEARKLVNEMISQTDYTDRSNLINEEFVIAECAEITSPEKDTGEINEHSIKHSKEKHDSSKYKGSWIYKPI